ncbi:MAG TPA: Ig-like domain-containing protein, partial [Nitrososphaeraceae archaeon]|nr:Ig-like domain-containing protein [Nitrososphaeraceae archaeon]
MRFSDKSHSKLYLVVTLSVIIFYFSGGFTLIAEIQIRIIINNVFGQVDDENKSNNENSPNTAINTAVDGDNNAIVNNGSTTSNSMKFSFSGSDVEGNTINRFECSVDGGSFVTCVSTNTVNVADGTHTFTVRSEDNDGNKDSTPASYRWTVNTETSNTQIDFATDGNDVTVTNNSNTRAHSMTFGFSGTDNMGSKIYRFECSLDGVPFVTCVSTNTVNVADGTHTFSVRSEDNAGNKDSTPASFTWTVDTTAPTTSISSAVDGNNNTISNNGNSGSRSIKFNFDSNDTGGVGINNHQCNIDNSRYVTCTSPFFFPNLLKDGSHTFTVLSQDNAGNKDSTPDSFTWTVDTTAPTTSISSAVDGNNNTISNNGNSGSRSIKFDFSGTDTAGVGVDHLECSIDNSKYVECTSPFEFQNLMKEGTHTFNVISADRAGNIDSSPASFSWTVDTAGPTTTIISAADGNKTILDNGSNTNSNSMSFEFSGKDTGGIKGSGAGIGHFECNIDNSRYVACTSPFVFQNILKDGGHTFTVLAVDKAGNKDSSPASFTWIVDTLEPLISIDKVMDGNGNVVVPEGNTSSNLVTIEFSGNDTGGEEGKGVGIKHFKCSLDGASFSICTSPVQLTSVNLPEGTHSFEIISEDNIGNINARPESFSWTIDTEPPIINIDYTTDGTKINITEGESTASNSIILGFSAIDSGGNEGNGVGVKRFECNIDSSEFIDCMSPLEITNLSDGVHTVEIMSEDEVGNLSPTPLSISWAVDTVPPNTTITNAIDANENPVANNSNIRFNSISFTFKGNDTDGVGTKDSGIEQFECSLDDSDFEVCSTPVRFTSENITEGSHVFRVLSEDQVGNKDQSPDLFRWTVDTVAPSTDIIKVTDGNNSTVTNGSNTRSNAVTIEFSGNDTGVGINHLECSLDDAPFSACTSPVHFTPPLITDSTHSFKVLSVDNSTNKDPTPASLMWTVDTVPPETSIVSAVDGNESVMATGQNTSSNLITFEFSANDTGGVGIDHFECSLDDASFTVCSSPVQFTSENITDGTHTFRVTSLDEEGNMDQSPDLFTWTVDTAAPTSEINSALDGNNRIVSNGSTTKSNEIVLEFSANDTGGVGIDHFECSLDGASFNVCASPVQITADDLLDGSHSFMVMAQDNVGNIMTAPILFNWTIDTLPPTTEINTAIDGNNGTLVSGDSTNSTSIVFTFSGNDRGINENNGVGIKQIQCSIDNSNFTDCVSPIEYDNLADGNHSLLILSEDNVGNRGQDPSSFNWTIDTEAPSTSIFSAIDGNNNFLIQGSNTSSSSIFFEFSANDTGGNEDKGVGIDQIECSVDSSNFTDCVSPLEISSDILEDGAHVFMIRAEDNVGNLSPDPSSFNWTIDTESPNTIISNVTDGNRTSISNGSNTRFNSATFEFSGNDTGVGISSFECSIDNSNFTTCSSPVQATNLTEGNHIVKIRSQDTVGNIDNSPTSFSWTVDTVEPLTFINSVIDGNMSIISTGGNSSSKTAIFEFSGTDSGVGLSHFECSFDKSKFITCESPLQVNNITDGMHFLETRAHDKVGNKDISLASFSWTVDTVPPETSLVSTSDGNRSVIKNGGSISSDTAIFEFSAADSGGGENKGVGIDKIECSIDNSNFISCLSPLAFNSLREGSHNLKILSRDNVGNVKSSPVSFTWVVDTIPPFSSINSVTDGNNQTLDNNDNTSSTSIEFTFMGTDSGGVGIGSLECSLDGGSFTECSSPIKYSSANISDGAHILEVRAEDKVGNLSPHSSFSWTVDTVPPDATIDSAIDGNKTIINTGSNTSSNSMLFNFSGEDTGGKEGVGVGIDHFECSLDNSNFTACTSPVRASNMADGAHILEVRAKDKVENVSPSPSSFTWTVDTTAPTTNIESGVDGTNIAISNGGNTKSTLMTFTFSGNDTGVGISSFECSIDNSNFTACTSPLQTGNLTDGEHIIEIRAQDNVGNSGDSTPFTWIVDTLSPETSIDSVTDGRDETIIINGNSSSNSVLVQFAGTDTGVGVDHFECSIDRSHFVKCFSPLQIDSLTDGTHTLSIASVDNSTNNDPSPALFSWTVDRTPPKTSINSVFDLNQTYISNGDSTKSTSLGVTFSGTDMDGVGIDHFECSIDNSDFVTCLVPLQFTNLEDGVHILKLRAHDKVGNISPSPVSFTLNVDTTPPATSINSSVDGNKSAVTNGGTTKSTSMTFTFSGTDTGGVDHFECSLDNSNFTVCISPIQFTSVNLGDGTHTFRVLSEDNSTNKDPTAAEFTWTVDTVSPSTTIVSAIDGNKTSLQTGGNTSSNSITFAFSANDTGGEQGKGVGINHFECNIDNSKFVNCTSPFTFRNLLKDGTHTFNVLSVDNSRNQDTSPASFTWTVDTTAPKTSINSSVDGNKTAVTNGGTTKSTSMSFTFSGNDTGGVGIDHFECNVDGLTFVACTSPFTFPSLSEDGQYTLEIRAHDRVGNRDQSSASFTWTVDTTPPTTSIDSATDGNNRVVNTGGNSSSNSMIFLFSSIDSGVGIDHSECSIDNSEFKVCSSPIQLTSTNLGDGTHNLKIISEDKVGNRGSTPASFNWTVDTIAPTAKIDAATDGNKSAVSN